MLNLFVSWYGASTDINDLDTLRSRYIALQSVLHLQNLPADKDRCQELCNKRALLLVLRTFEMSCILGGEGANILPTPTN